MYELKDTIYLFDLDGTLMDSMPTAVKIVLSLLDEKGIAYADDIVETLTPLGFQGISRYYAEGLGVPMTAEEIFAWFTEKLKVAYAKEIPLKEGAREALLALKAQGARMCVLTGSPHVFTDACLKREGVYDFFERVWSSDDFGLLKGDTRIYGEVAKALGVEVKDLLVIDDGLHVLKTAKAAGAQVVGVYDAYSATMEQLQETAGRAISSLTQLLN